MSKKPNKITFRASTKTAKTKTSSKPVIKTSEGTGDALASMRETLERHGYTGNISVGGGYNMDISSIINQSERSNISGNTSSVGLSSDEEKELDVLRKKRSRSATQAESLMPQVREISNDGDRLDDTYKAWAQAYDNGEVLPNEYARKVGKEMSEKYKAQDNVLRLFDRYTAETERYDKRIAELEKKAGERDKNGAFVKNGEVDYERGKVESKKQTKLTGMKSQRNMVGETGVSSEDIQGAAAGMPASAEAKAIVGQYKANTSKEKVAKSKERAYDYYGRNKDNTYGNNIIGRAFGNMMVGDVGIKTNEAGKTIYDANSDDLEAVGVYQTLSNRITQSNRATFTNNNDFDRNWATFFNYVPQFVEQTKHRLAGMAVGATLGAMSAGAVGASEGARVGGSAAVAKFMFDQTAGAAYVRHLQNSGLSVEDAKKLASSEAIPSSLIEFGLDFAISGLFKGVGGTAGKIMQRFGTNAGNIEGGIVKGLMRTGLKQRAAETAISAAKSAGKTVLSGLGEGAEEWLQSALEKTADRAAQRGQALNPLELVGESLDFTQYTAQDLAEMNQEFLGGALIGLVGAPLRAGSFGAVNKMIDVVSEPSLGKQVRTSKKVNATVEAGLQSANRRIVALANKVQNGGSDRELGRLYKAVTKEKYRAAGDVIGNEGENLNALVKEGLGHAEGSDARQIATDISERQRKGQYVAQTEVDALVQANDRAEEAAARKQAPVISTPVSEAVSEVPEDVIAERESLSRPQKTPEINRINNRLILAGVGDNIRNDIMAAAESLNAAGRNVVDIFNTVDKNVRNGLSAIGGQPNGSQYGRLFRSGVRFAADANASITPEYIADTVESFLDIAGQSNETYRSVRTEPVVEAILSGASDGIIEPIRNYISDAVASDVRVHNGIYGVSPELNEQAAAVARGDYSFLRSATAETSAQSETTEQPVASARPKKTVTLYPVGDFYEVYGDDARAVAQAAKLHLSSKVVGGKRTPMTGFPKTALSSYAPQIGSYAIADADTIADEIVRSGFNDDRLINTDAVSNMSDDDLKVINDIFGGRNVDITPNSEATENSTDEGTTTSDNIIRTLKKSSISTVFKGENKVVFYDSFILSPYFAVPRSSANEAAVRKAVKGEIKTSSANIGADALILKNYTEVNSEARVMTGAPIDGKKIDLYVYNIDGKLWGVQQKYLNAVSGYILRAGELRGRFMFNAVVANGDLIAVLPPVKMNNLTETEFDKLPTVTEVLSQNVAKPKAMFTPSELKTLNSPSRHMGKFKSDRGTVLSSGGYFELLCDDDEIASLEQDYTQRHKDTSWGSDVEKSGFPEETGAPKRAWELVSNAENINTEMRGASKNFNAAIIDGKYAIAFDKKYTNILKKRSTKLVLRDTDNHTVLAGVDENGDLTGFFPPIRSSVANKESSDGLEFVDKISDATSNKGSSETAAAENQTDLTDKCELIETTHTKTGEALWVIRVKDKLSKDEYAELQAKVKEVGGYYSRFAKTPDGKSAPGFVFKTEPDNAVIKVFNSFFGATSEKKPAETSNTGLNTETKDDTIEENTAKTPTQKVADFIYKRLAAGEKTTGEELFRAAKEAYQGGMADGTFTPKDAYDAMELGVNQYILSLDEVSSEKMLDILDKLPTQTKRTEAMEKYQQFSTPPSIAYLASYAANINSNDIMLEPSAGIGGIAVFAKREGATVYVNELDKRRLGVIKNLPFDGFYNENAEQIHNILGRKIKPTVVVMNPPFSSSSERNIKNTKIGAKHIEQALKMLAPGGRLVAITGKGMSDGAPAFRSWWKDIKAKYNVVANIGVDGKNYNKYGTTFDIQMIVIDNNGSTDTTVTAKVDTLNELENLLGGIRNGRTEIDYDGLSRTTETADTARERNTGTEARERSTDESGEESSRSQAVSDTSRGDDADRRVSDESVDDGNRLSGTSGRAESDVSGRAADVDNGRTDADGRRDRGADDRREVSGQQRSEADRGLRREGSEEQGRDVEEDARSINAERAAEYNNRESDRSGTEAGDDGDGGRGLSKQSDDLRVKPKKTKKKKFLTDSIYDDYVVQPLKVKNARPHPTKVSESSAMASVSKPAITYKPHIQQELIDNGVLSDVQLEPISYAGQNHQHFLENGKRKGFFIGDGTGLGKGRIVAGIILDNRNQGRNKAVWISERPNLFSDAQRDIKAVVGDENLVHQFEGGKKADKSLNFDDGVLFAAYPSLSKGWDKPGSNFEKIVEWLGKDYDGVIAFDESHNMANSGGSKKGFGRTKPSGAFLMGRALSEKFPKARIVYLSATGATEVENLQYADRLGLWGSGTAFRDATDFVEKIKAGGVAAMELVASNMKENGVYLSRNISYDGVEYDRITHKLNKDQRETYGELARAWQLVLKNMNEALKATNQNTDGMARGRQNSAFWSGQQRFFNQVLTAMQTPSVIKDIEKQLEQGKSAVIQLVSTNEAAQKRESERLQEEGLDLESFDLTPKQILMSYIENVFPTQQYEEYVDDDGNKRSKPVYDSNGNPVLNAEAVEKKEELLMKLGALKVPSSPIDMIIEHFGADQVAEVTGRSKRVYRKGGKMVEETRNKSTNAVDVDAFQNGDKRILVFSGAGATGKSYHADRNAKNQQQRVHYLLEAGWVANKAVQGFGRSHRSNQATTPIFKLVTTDLKGQNRFISTIAKRLSQLGALTKGSAKAGNQGMFTADDDLEGPIASDVLANYYKELMLGKVPTVDDGMDIIEKLGLKNYLVDEYGSFKEHDAWRDVTKFLNRILVLEPDEQNAVFDGFNNRLLAANEIARQNGTLDRGLENYRADNLSIKESKIVRTDETTRAQTTYYNLEAKHKITPIGFGSIKTDDPAFEGFYRNKNNDTVRAMFRSNTKTDEYGRIIQNYRSQTPIGYNYLDEGQLARNWEKIKSDEAKTLWDKAVKDSPAYRTNPVHLLTGNLLSIWGKMPSENVRVYRMMTDDGNVLLGRVIANDQIDVVLRQLGSSRTKEIVPAAEIIRKIQKDGATVYLEDGWRIKQSRVSNEPRLEIIGPEYRDMQALERAGVFSERISWTTRFFIPTGDKAPDVLDKVLRISGLVRIDSKDEVFSLEEDDEREDVSDGSSERQDGNGAGIAARRVDQRSRSYQKGRETADHRREQGKTLKDAGNTEQKEYGRGLRRVRGEFIKREAYNPRMQAIAAENKSRGINTEFILGTLDISYHPKNKARGMYDRATNTIIVQYDHPYYSPEQLNRHELYHAEAGSERGKKALNVIRNSLSLVDRKTALDKLERDYNGITSGNEDIIIEEFVANTLAGMNEYAETYQELVNDYWDGNEIDESRYEPSQYTKSTDAGGRKLTHIVENTGYSMSDNDINDLFYPENINFDEYDEKIDKWLKGELGSAEILQLGDTPLVMQELKVQNLPLIMQQDVLSKATGDEKDHNVDLDTLRDLPILINDPLVVMESKTVTGAYVLLTEDVDKSGRPVIAALHVDKRQNRLRINKIASVYGRNNFEAFIANEERNGRIKYVDDIKIQAWSTSRGLRLPKLVQSNPVNNNILYKSDIVNRFSKNNYDDLSFSLDTIEQDEAEYTPEKRAEMLEDFRNDNMAVKKKTVQESLIGASAHIKDMASRLARVFPEIPERGKEGTFYAEFRKNMVQWKALPQTASFKVQDTLRNMTKDLDPDDYEIFSQLVYFLDLQEEAEMQESRGVENVRLPHGYTHAQVNGIVDDLQNEASDKVKAALKKRIRIWKELVNSYVANNQYIGFDTANRFNRKHYYRHQVIDYMNTRGIGGKRTEINDRRGWLKARKGSDLATNTDFLEVEYNAMLQMTHDMYVANLLGKTKQRYDIKPQLELQARRLNQNAIKEIIKKEANGRMTAKGEPDSETFRQQQWYNRRIMMGFSNLMDLGSMGKLPELGGGYRNVIAALSSGSLKANGLYKYIGELAATEDIDEDVRIAAQTVLKFTNQKRQWVKALLGNGFNTWETLAKATEGYSIHQPRRGNYFYNKTIIDEDAFAQAFNTVVTSIAAGDPGIFTPESMKEMIEQYGETVRLIGAPYEQWVIPDKIIKTLDEVANPKEGGTGSLIARSMLNAWKGWSTSVNPLRTLKFGLRNLVGDVDAVIAGKPQVLTYTPRAVKEIYQAMVKKNYTPDMQEWIDRGGYTSMMFINEMDREAQEKLFKNLVDKTGKGVFEALKIPKKLVSGYTDKVQAMHDFREAILRYSSYLYFKDNLAENEGKVTDYVASNRWIVQGLESNEDKAYQLSKDLLGAYDEVSRIGQNLRRYWIPFYSFTETNFKRYTRMFENVIRGQGSIPKKAAKVLLKALQVNLLAMLVIAWNRLLKKDDNDKLPPSVRNIPHITLGRIGEDVYAFRQLGSFTELLEWIGLDDFKWDEEDLLAPVDKLTGMITPAISGTASMLTGLNFYPSVRNPQVIRDRWSYFFNSLGVDGPFDIWRGKPNKGWGNVAKGAFVYSYDIEESAYNEIISHKYNWQGRDDGTIYGATDKSNALYYMKKAIKYKDEETALKYLDKYFEAGGTGNGIASSLERLNPMYGFTGKDTQAKGKEWIASMTDDEKDKLRVAIQYYEQDLSLPKEVAAQLRKKKNGVTDQEAKNLLQRYIKAKCK